VSWNKRCLQSGATKTTRVVAKTAENHGKARIDQLPMTGITRGYVMSVKEWRRFRSSLEATGLCIADLVFCNSEEPAKLNHSLETRSPV
jgi:hypothetical protein